MIKLRYRPLNPLRIPKLACLSHNQSDQQLTTDVTVGGSAERTPCIDCGSDYPPDNVHCSE